MCDRISSINIMQHSAAQCKQRRDNRSGGGADPEQTTLSKVTLYLLLLAVNNIFYVSSLTDIITHLLT